MSETRTRRGRPKGSGIDDRQRLAAIARLIASNPALKPTTAIRALGVSDPSVIRRLRDKFNAVRTELMHDLDGAAAASAPSSATRKRKSEPSSLRPTSKKIPTSVECDHPLGGPKMERPRSIAASSPKAATRISAVSKATTGTAITQPHATRSAARAISPPSKPHTHAGDDDSERLPAQSAPPTEAADMLTSIFSAGVAATNTLMAAHSTLANEFLRSPYMSLALRQQLAFSEWAVGLVPIFQVSTKTAT
ncbi:MAG TPA: hypothetical protein P5114_08140 [Hyphomicrobiaceae bacterium]|nr:hypothetical protein [Hyphomicrobiaceae bacterium]